MRVTKTKQDQYEWTYVDKVFLMGAIFAIVGLLGIPFQIGLGSIVAFLGLLVMVYTYIDVSKISHDEIKRRHK